MMGLSGAFLGSFLASSSGFGGRVEAFGRVLGANVAARASVLLCTFKSPEQSSADPSGCGPEAVREVNVNSEFNLDSGASTSVRERCWFCQ